MTTLLEPTTETKPTIDGMPLDVETALDQLRRLSSDGYALITQDTRYFVGEAKPTEWRATARINDVSFTSDPAPSAMHAVSGWVAEVKKAQVKASESVAMLEAHTRDRFEGRDPERDGAEDPERFDGME